jgi:hypothetical protein
MTLRGTNAFVVEAGPDPPKEMQLHAVRQAGSLELRLTYGNPTIYSQTRCPPEVPPAPQRDTSTNLKHGRMMRSILLNRAHRALTRNIHVWHPTCTSIFRLTAEPGFEWSKKVFEFCGASTPQRSNRSPHWRCLQKYVFLLVMLGNR